MKTFTTFTILAITLAASISAAPSNDATFSIVERDTPTCWLDDKIGGTCDFKCGQRGAKSGSCKTGTCVCSYSKRDNLSSSSDEHVQSKRDQDVHQFHKRWSCQIGEIGGKGLSNALCSASCADASGGKKDGYCDKNDTCICKA